jgi:predicted component of type VI protein secretion system
MCATSLCREGHACAMGFSMASLRVIRKLYRTGPDDPTIKPLILSKERSLIGRHPPERSIDLQLPDGAINKRHAVIIRSNGSYWIEDLKSRNGTLVNSSSIRKRTLLKDGDEIQMGPFVLLFQTDAEPDGRQ